MRQIDTNHCKTSSEVVSFENDPEHLENDIRTLPTVAEPHTITTSSGCSATLRFNDRKEPGLRRQIAELLLRSLQKWSAAT